MTSSSSDRINLDTRIAVASTQLTSQLGDESVILSLDDGMYYGLDPIGTRVWALLDQPRTTREVCAEIVRDYDVETGACETAVFALFQDLVARGLADIHA